MKDRRLQGLRVERHRTGRCGYEFGRTGAMAPGSRRWGASDLEASGETNALAGNFDRFVDEDGVVGWWWFMVSSLVLSVVIRCWLLA